MVFPAYAGVFLPHTARGGVLIGLPRIRGGVSKKQQAALQKAPSSPHTRGCFRGDHHKGHRIRVFPAYAGVFRLMEQGRSSDARLPRIRGGVSAAPFR